MAGVESRSDRPRRNATVPPSGARAGPSSADRGVGEGNGGTPVAPHGIEITRCATAADEDGVRIAAHLGLAAEGREGGLAGHEQKDQSDVTLTRA